MLTVTYEKIEALLRLPKEVRIQRVFSNRNRAVEFIIESDEAIKDITYEVAEGQCPPTVHLDSCSVCLGKVIISYDIFLKKIEQTGDIIIANPEVIKKAFKIPSEVDIINAVKSAGVVSINLTSKYEVYGWTRRTEDEDLVYIHKFTEGELNG